MLRAFWTWDPVSAGEYRAFDESYAYENNKWFFDKSVWQKMFRTMGGCGFDAMVLANSHPFPFMVDLAGYPEAKVIDINDLVEYQRMHHWIIETARDYDIAPYLLFFNQYIPSALLKSKGIDPNTQAVPTDFAIEYTNYCVRQVLEQYPGLAGLYTDVSRNIADNKETFIQQSIIDAIDAVRPDAALYIRGCNQPEDIAGKISRRGNKPIRYSVKYTCGHLVNSNPDPDFARWVTVAGGQNVSAEFSISNFEPWTSFSYDTAEGVLNNLEDLNCDGFSLQPLALYDWPKSSDTYFKYQWQRDLVWYNTWGGKSISQMLRHGQPKWLLRNHKLVPGFQAASLILELLALYFAGNKQSSWHPQFCSIYDCGEQPHLFSIYDMLNMQDYPVFSGRDWWREVTGDRVVHLDEYLKSGTPENAYGPDELIEELADLSEQAIAAGEKGMRSNSGEKELPSLSRDALCMGRLGEFYGERIRAALAHARGEDTEALEHMLRAAAFYKEIKCLDSSHRSPFRVVSGNCASVGGWDDVVKALEKEYSDASRGEFKPGSCYPVHKLEECV